MGEASQAAVAKEFDLTPASMSTMTVRLLRMGLIERRVDERELRSNVLTLTKDGRNLMQAIHHVWHEADDIMREPVHRSVAHGPDVHHRL